MSDEKRRDFQIEPFKNRVLDSSQAEMACNNIQCAVRRVYNKNTNDLSFEELHRSAYSMVLNKFGEMLYSGLVTTMTAILEEISISVEAADQDDLFLEELYKKWNDHNNALKIIGEILMYMDRVYVPNAHKAPVNQLGLNLWRDHIIYSDRIRSRLLKTLLELVRSDRDGEIIDWFLLKNILKMLMDLGSSVYREEFEKPFLEDSAEFYKDESQKFLEICDCGDYLKCAERRLKEEIQRVENCMDATSEAKITNVVEKEMIVNHMMRLVHMENSGLTNMLLENQYEDLCRMYNLFSHPELADGPTLVVQVLTTENWPIRTGGICQLPSEMLALCKKFRSYYIGAHTGRRLSWQTNMGTADIKATFGKDQKHELNVSTYQMCVLMLFNDADRLSYKEIEQDTRIPAPDLRRCLQSLACVKGKNVIRKEPMSKDIDEDDEFYVNEKFTSKLYKVKIGTVSAQKESEPEKKETRQRVEEDRKCHIEAAIVRIMKSRRVQNHNKLVTEVIKQLQPLFFANPTEIRKRIESLIEREFLVRDADDKKLYVYLP